MNDVVKSVDLLSPELKKNQTATINTWLKNLDG